MSQYLRLWKIREKPMLSRAMKLSFFAVTFVLAASGCSKHDSDSNPISPGSNTISEPATDKWLGKWVGPEGTFLLLTGGNGKYEITIQNLDGPLHYQGTTVDGQIQFMRNDMIETIRATNGEETGMKWLSDKSNCLTIRSSEGYCR